MEQKTRFVNKLKSGLVFVFMMKCIIISMVTFYNVKYQSNFVELSGKPPRPKPSALFLEHPQKAVKKRGPLILYSDMFTEQRIKQNVSLLIVVLSAIGKFKRREMIRRTWWKECKIGKEVACVFLTDSLEGESNTNRIRQEMDTHNDIITSPVKKGLFFGHRILFALQWAVHNYNFKYFLRSDDDVFICMEQMQHRLKFLPTNYYMSGVLHCADEGLVYLDEGIITFSKDLVLRFLSQRPDRMRCHTYGDQTYTTWIQDLGLNQTRLYHIETKIHHDPPASRVVEFESMTNICQRYIAVHGVYGQDMIKFWNRRGSGSVSNNTGLVELNRMCPYRPHYNWRKFQGIYGFEPKLCNDHSTWKYVEGTKFQSRE